MKPLVCGLSLLISACLLIAFGATGCAEPTSLVPSNCHSERADDGCLWSNTEEGWLEINSLEDLETACGSRCSKAQKIRLSIDNDLEDLPRFDGFDFVTEVEDLYISIEHAQHFAAFPNIKKVERLEFERNPVLETIEPFTGLETLIEGGLYLRRNYALQDLTAFSSLRSVGHPDQTFEGAELYLFRNNSLVDLSGLENLEFIYRLVIGRNESLESFKGLDSLEEVQTIHVNDNSRLSSLEGLEQLRTVRTFWFVRNPKLRRCELEAFIEQLEAEPRIVRIEDVSEEPCD